MLGKISSPFDPKFPYLFNELVKAVQGLYVDAAYPLEVVYRAGSQQLRLVPQEMDGIVTEVVDTSDSEGSDTGEPSGAYIVEEVFPLKGGDWHSESIPRRVVAYGYNKGTVGVGTYVKCYYTSVGDWRFIESGVFGFGGFDNASDQNIPTLCVKVMADLVCEGETTVKKFVWIPILANVDCQPSSDESVS